MQHGQVGKFKVLDLHDSAVLEHGQVGSCADWGSWAASGASELGWFDSALDCFQPQGLQCPVADLDRFAWQQVGNLQCLCSMGRLASLKCWVCLTVQCWSMVRFGRGYILQWPDLFCPVQIGDVATLPGDSFAWQQVGNLQCQCSMGRLASLKC